MSIHKQHESDMVKVVIEKRDQWYYVNGWARASKRHAWRHVIIDHIHLSYLKAHNEYIDHGAILYHYKNQFSVLTDAA